MQKEIKLESPNEIKDFSEYAENKLAIAKICVLSTAHNSHHLEISEDVLRRDIGSIRGNFLVADMVMGEATTHTSSEVPVGYFLPNEEIEFEEVDTDEGKVVKAWAYAVLSKQYAKSAYEMFINDNHRATSIEMTVLTDEEDENKVISFDAFGSTILGKTVAPSCKDAEISLVRFAEEANNFYGEHKNKPSMLKQFAKERIASMAKTYKIDKSKEAMSDKAWGEVDKTAMRDKIMEADDKATLVKAVYMLVEDGWEEAPSEHLKYPVMELKGDTFVYNRDGLASALGYAKKENETTVVNKIEKIYKKLGLDDGKEVKSKMAEVEFSAVNIGDMWSRIWDIIDQKREWDYSISGIYEEDNQKFAILKNRDQNLYRLNFTLTEEGLTASDEVIEVKQDFIDTDNIRKFSEPENVEQYQKFVEAEPEKKEMSLEEAMDKIANLESEIEKRDNIIMENEKSMKEKDIELSDLRTFKQTCMEAERGSKVEAVMSEVSKFMDKAQAEESRKEGLTCEFSAVDAWANKVKASVFDKMSKASTKEGDFTRMSAPVEIKKTGSVWDRL